MTIGKKIRWILLGAFGLVCLLFFTLVVHIAVMVYHKGSLPFEHIQMARVDFNAPLDSARIDALQADLLAQNGVKSSFFNTGDHNVVYTFDNRLNSSQNIYRNIFQQASIGAKPYIVSTGDLARGCPVMDNNSFYGKLTAVISKAIN